jgi:hypothetical protein
MKTFGRAILSAQDAHGVQLTLPNGGTFGVQALEPSLFRVRYRPSHLGYSAGPPGKHSTHALGGPPAR